MGANETVAVRFQLAKDIHAKLLYKARMQGKYLRDYLIDELTKLSKQPMMEAD